MEYAPPLKEDAGRSKWLGAFFKEAHRRNLDPTVLKWVDNGMAIWVAKTKDHFPLGLLIAAHEGCAAVSYDSFRKNCRSHSIRVVRHEGEGVVLAHSAGLFIRGKPTLLKLSHQVRACGVHSVEAGLIHSVLVVVILHTPVCPCAAVCDSYFEPKQARTKQCSLLSCFSGIQVRGRCVHG